MAKNREQITQEEIAIAADLSIATVCRALGSGKSVSQAIRHRVLEAREQVRQLHAQLRDRRIALVIPNSRAFFSELAFEFERECQRIGAELLIANSDGHTSEELALLRRFSDGRAHGILLVSTSAAPSGKIVEVHRSHSACPIVCVDRAVDGLDCVAVDGRAGTIQAVQHLCRSGHTKIGYIRGLRTSSTADQRYHAFQEALTMEDVRYEPAWTFWGDYNRASGEKVARLLSDLPAQDRPTALVSANDEMAISLIYGLNALGWRLPEDLSIVGFDGIDPGTWIEPTLTTIRQPLSRLVREAMRALCLRMVDESRELIVSEVQPHLLLRQSVASLRPNRERVLGVGDS